MRFSRSVLIPQGAIAIFVFLCSCAMNDGGTSTTPVSPTSDLLLTDVVHGAIGPFSDHCDGYGNPGATGLGYITVLTLETGRGQNDLDEVLNGIVAFDNAEASGTYIGQINMIQASSFNGSNGAIWGYDVAQADAIAHGGLKALFTKSLFNGTTVPVYPIEPLLDAGRRLFGVVDKKRYPMLPGSHIVSANKTLTAIGPTVLWCALAMAIATERTKDATLFMEDCGKAPLMESQESRQSFFSKVLHDMAESINRIAENQGTRYKEIFVGYKAQYVPEGSTGNALVAIPYVVLAKNAVPAGGPARLLDLTITEWEKDRSLSPLPPAR